MIQNQKNYCLHIKDKLIDIEKFKKIPFNELKCELCDKIEDILICLIYGHSFYSQYKKGHYESHYHETDNHCLYISILNLSLFCNDCYINYKRGAYIKTEKMKEYMEIIIKNKKKNNNELKNEKDENKNEEIKFKRNYVYI